MQTESLKYINKKGCDHYDNGDIYQAIKGRNGNILRRTWKVTESTSKQGSSEQVGNRSG